MSTKTGYKLFEEDKDGNLYSLFINKNEIIPIGKWLSAKYLPTKGFACRGGWHIGDIPDAPWLKGYNGTDVGCYKSRWKKGRRVWCLVEYNATNDYNEIVSELPKKCFVDKIPENGFYYFKEYGKGTWSISSDIKIIRKISEAERQILLSAIGYNEAEAYKKYKDAFEKRLETNKDR